jgi:hypothetical protein
MPPKRAEEGNNNNHSPESHDAYSGVEGVQNGISLRKRSGGGGHGWRLSQEAADADEEEPEE